MVRFVNWYVERLHRAAHNDEARALAFQRVAHLVAPPPSILAPNLALRVLRGNLRRSVARPFGVRLSLIRVHRAPDSDQRTRSAVTKNQLYPWSSRGIPRPSVDA